MTLAGFPHSGIAGSTLTCSSPTLFAAYRALLRLSVPRHPPCALLSLDRIVSLAPVKREDAPVHLIAITHAWCSSRSTQIFSLPIPITRIFKQLWSRSALQTNARPVRAFRAAARRTYAGLLASPERR